MHGTYITYVSVGITYIENHSIFDHFKHAWQCCTIIVLPYQHLRMIYAHFYGLGILNHIYGSDLSGILSLIITPYLSHRGASKYKQACSINKHACTSTH